MWAGDEVEGGRADFGSWAVQRGDGLRAWNLRGSRRAGGKKLRGDSETSGTGLKVAMGRKGGNKKIKEKGFLLFSEFIFGKRII
jgi:hypothetical protein